MCLKYFVDAGAMAVRRVVKKDLKRIAKASGGICPFFVVFLFLLFVVFFFSKSCCY